MLSLTPLAATGIGSVPFTDPEETVSLILENLPQVPFWPQMVRLGFREEMTAQAARGLAALKIDEAARIVELDPEVPRDEALAQFYEAVLSGDLEPFAMEEKEAHGFYALLTAVAARKSPCRALKGQLAGPVTFAGMVKDPAGKAILFDRELTQAACQGLARKAAWQAQIPGAGQRPGHLSRRALSHRVRLRLSAHLPGRSAGNPGPDHRGDAASRGRAADLGGALLRQHRLGPAAGGPHRYPQLRLLRLLRQPALVR